MGGGIGVVGREGAKDHVELLAEGRVPIAGVRGRLARSERDDLERRLAAKRRIDSERRGGAGVIVRPREEASLSLSLHALGGSARRSFCGAAATLRLCIRSSRARSTPCGPRVLYVRGLAVGVLFTEHFLRLGVPGERRARWTGATSRRPRYRLMVGDSSGAGAEEKTSGRVHWVSPAYSQTHRHAVPLEATHGRGVEHARRAG
jgi:hypothetical protein